MFLLQKRERTRVFKNAWAGRGGDQITKIQADTGCRVAVVPQPTGSVTRPCTLTGTTEQILGKYR